MFLLLSHYTSFGLGTKITSTRYLKDKLDLKIFLIRLALIK